MAHKTNTQIPTLASVGNGIGKDVCLGVFYQDEWSATIEQRLLTCPFADASESSRSSNLKLQRRNSSPPTQPSTIPSTSNAI